jgi:TatD DNase family protein
MIVLIGKKGKKRLFDVAANLADLRFKGVYFGKQCHPPDLERVLKRCLEYGVDKLLLGGTYLEDSMRSYEIAETSTHYYSTIGVHPCRASEPAKIQVTLAEYFATIEHAIQDMNKHSLVAIGECGLDYDRFKFADKITQNK